MASCTVKFDNNNYSYEEFAIKLHNGLLAELVNDGSIDISKLTGEVPKDIFQFKEGLMEPAIPILDLETRYKNKPESLDKNEIKELLNIKRERLKRAKLNLEKGEFTSEQKKVKIAGIASLEKSIEEIIDRANKLSGKELKDAKLEDAGITTKQSKALEVKYATDEEKSKVLAAVKKAQKTLKSLFPFMSIYVYEDTESYLKAIGEKEGKLSRGAFRYRPNMNGGLLGAIHINLELANEITVYHEMAHAILVKAFIDNKLVFEDFKNSVTKIIKEFDYYKGLNRFIDTYEDSDKAEEFITELSAVITKAALNDRQVLKVLENKNAFLRLKILINKLLSKLTGGQFTLFKETKEAADIILFLNSFSENIRKGEEFDLQDLYQRASKFDKTINQTEIIRIFPNEEVIKLSKAEESKESKYKELKNTLFGGMSANINRLFFTDLLNVANIRADNRSDVAIMFDNATFWLSESNDGYVTIDDFQVNDDKLGEGKGSKALKKLIEFADRNNIVLIGDPLAQSERLMRSKKGLTQKELINFYKKYGFTKISKDTLSKNKYAETNFLERIPLISNNVEEVKSQRDEVKDRIKKYVKNILDEGQKMGLTPLKTRAELIDSINKDLNFFKDLVEYAALSIKLGYVKSIKQLSETMKRDLGYDFGKTAPNELKKVYEEAKVKIIEKAKLESERNPKTGVTRVTTTFKNWISQLNKEKTKSFKLGKKIGDIDRKEIQNSVLEYMKSIKISNLSISRILSIVKESLKIKTFENLGEFTDFIDSLVSRADYHAKVQDAKNLAKSVATRVRKDTTYGNLVPIIREALAINVTNLSEKFLDQYIDLMKNFMGNIVNVKDINNIISAIKENERQNIENSFRLNLFSESKAINLFERLEQLNDELKSDILTGAELKALTLKRNKQIDAILTHLRENKIEIESSIPETINILGNEIIAPPDAIIKNASDYYGLISSIKSYNKAVSEALGMGLISEETANEMFIDITSDKINSIEKSLADILSDFKGSLINEIKNLVNSINDALQNGGLKTDLFNNLSAKDKEIYSKILDGLLDINPSVYDKLSVSELDDIRMAFEQAQEGYVSPLLLKITHDLKVKTIALDLESNIEQYIEDEAKTTRGLRKLFSKASKSLKDFTNLDQFTQLLKSLEYHEVDAYIKESGLGKIFARYLYFPLSAAYSKYSKKLADLISLPSKIGNSMDEIDRYIVGILMIQADYMMWNGYDSLSNEDKDFVTALLKKHNADNPITFDSEKLLKLQNAKDKIIGDITTKEGLEKFKAKYFAKNKKAGELFKSIRKVIDNDLYSMSKINTESEGGFFEFFENYTPIQRRGAKQDTTESFEESLGIIRKYPNIKLRSSATYKRVGNPLVFREFDALAMFQNHVEEVTKNFYIKPIYARYLSAVNELATKYSKKGDSYISVFLQSSSTALKDAFALRFNQLEKDNFLQVIKKINTFGRYVYLANIFRPLQEFKSNVTKIIFSIRPNQYGDLFASTSLGKLFGVKKSISDDVFDMIADLVGSSISLKTDSTNIEYQYGSYKARTSKIDAIQGISDLPAQRMAWKTTFLTQFRKKTGKDFDKVEFQKNPLNYFRKYRKSFEDSVFEADKFTDKKFITQSPIGRSTTMQAIPFLKSTTYEKGGKLDAALNYMNAYIAGDYRVFWAATKRVKQDPSTRNIGDWISDVLPIFASNLMYTALAPFAKMTGAIVGQASGQIGGYILAKLTPDPDDDKELDELWDDITSYDKEVFEEMLKQTYSLIYNKDGSIAWQNYSKIIATMMLGKFAFGARLTYGVVTGLYVSTSAADAGNAGINEAKEELQPVNKYLEFKPIVIFGKSSALTKISDGADILPTAGIPINIISTLIDPKNPTSAVYPYSITFGEKSLLKKENKIEDVDMQLLVTGLSQISLLTLTAFGYHMAPTAYKAVLSPSKMEAAKRFRESEGAKKQTGGGFSFPSFSKKFGGGFGGGGFGK